MSSPASVREMLFDRHLDTKCESSVGEIKKPLEARFHYSAPRQVKYADAIGAAVGVAIAFNGAQRPAKLRFHKAGMAMAAAVIQDEDHSRLHHPRIGNCSGP